MKMKIILIILTGVLGLSLTSYELERKDVLNGELSMLIPKDFIHISKENYIPEYDGAPKPDDYYCNADTTIEISFLKTPKHSNDLNWCKGFSKMAFLMLASKTYFNDTLTNNGIKMHLTEFESTFKGKKTYSKVFFINMENYTVIGNISCDIELKKQWIPYATKIFKSIKLN